jgi:hypothetical protein
VLFTYEKKNELKKIEYSFEFEKATEPGRGCYVISYWKTALTKNSMPKENETSKMKITNGDDHYFLKILKFNFIPLNKTFFTKYYYPASLNNSKYSENIWIEGFKNTPNNPIGFNIQLEM